jgi:hypothetical protein
MRGANGRALPDPLGAHRRAISRLFAVIDPWTRRRRATQARARETQRLTPRLPLCQEYQRCPEVRRGPRRERSG